MHFLYLLMEDKRNELLFVFVEGKSSLVVDLGVIGFLF